MQPTSRQLSEIEDLYRAGMYLQAYRASQAIGPLSEWTGTEPMVLAGRLAMNLGNPQLSRVLQYLAWRRDRSHPLAANYHGRQLEMSYGPYAAWRHYRRLGFVEDGTPELQAGRLSCVSSLLIQFRDFDRAQQCIDRALELAPDEPWHCVDQARLLLARDRRQEALEWAQRSVARGKWYRPGIAILAECYIQASRTDEATALLIEASTHIESNAIVYQGRAGTLDEVGFVLFRCSRILEQERLGRTSPDPRKESHNVEAY